MGNASFYSPHFTFVLPLFTFAGVLCVSKIIVIIGGCPPRKLLKKNLPSYLQHASFPWKCSPYLFVVWVQAITVVLVFTYMVSHAIAPSHHRERKIWQYAFLIPKQYSSAMDNTVSKINATFLWAMCLPLSPTTTCILRLGFLCLSVGFGRCV